ncbi:CgeB family protein, partial [Pasteurella multocida]
MKIYLISDSLTNQSLLLNNIDTSNSWFYLKKQSNPILLVESAWQGYKNRWKYKIASYPENPNRTNRKLARLVQRAKDKGIPTIFWNKEDSIHFDRFIDSAKYFDHI